MPSYRDTSKFSPKLLLRLINTAKNIVKESDAYKDMCDTYKVDYSIIDLVPVKFDDIDVSATTNYGIVSLNYSLLNDSKSINKIPSLLQHETAHFLQQSSEPTQSADVGDYLLNPYEQESFQYQLKFIDEEQGKQEAEKYVNQVLNHHEVSNKKERKEKKEKLMKLVDEDE